jgi:hypothetical protein
MVTTVSDKHSFSSEILSFNYDAVISSLASNGFENFEILYNCDFFFFSLKNVLV